MVWYRHPADGVDVFDAPHAETPIRVGDGLPAGGARPAPFQIPPEDIGPGRNGFYQSHGMTATADGEVASGLTNLCF